MRKILIAVGGSGGHLFPAQAFADKHLKEQDCEILFAGAKLSENRYFHKEKYAYKDVRSATPFGGVKKTLSSIFPLLQGVKESLKLLEEFSPDCVIGFGSFHAFPLLTAATLKKLPLILFESNRIPGKVSRLFSRFAKVTALYFPEAAKSLKGEHAFVEMPMQYQCTQGDPEEARRYFGLDPSLPTLLVFGGSQGALAINALLMQVVEERSEIPFQVIHFVGKEEACQEIRKHYEAFQVPACVKAFEPRMDLAYFAATLAITRSGAATLAELLTFKVPSVIIPYPHAAEGHQLENAKFLQDCVGGSLYYEEKNLDPGSFRDEVFSLLKQNSEKRIQMQRALETFSKEEKRPSLSTLVQELH